MELRVRFPARVVVELGYQQAGSLFPHTSSPPPSRPPRRTLEMVGRRQDRGSVALLYGSAIMFVGEGP
jgi:hypothetical protein